MTAALAKALETYNEHWLSAGFERSCLRVVNGVIYAVVIDREGNALELYRVSRKRLNVTRAQMWPSALALEFARKVEPTAQRRTG